MNDTSNTQLAAIQFAAATRKFIVLFNSFLDTINHEAIFAHGDSDIKFWIDCCLYISALWASGLADG